MAMLVNLIALVFLFTDVRARGCDGRIIGGTDTSTLGHLHQVSLTHRNGMHICGGSVIGQYWVLTAAHCINRLDKAELQVVVDKDRHHYEYNLAEIYMHPHYQRGVTNIGFLPNDIALLKTDSAIDNADYNKIALPVRDETFVGEICKITGWGLVKNDKIIKILQETNGIIYNDDECSSHYGSKFNHDHNICIHNEDNGTCHGDIGGPVVCDCVLVGVLSFGAYRCITSYPSVYTRVAKFIDWIQSTTGMSL